MARGDHGSEYTVPEGATGLSRVFGTFADQRILGYGCDIIVLSVLDNKPGVRDLLGRECVMVGDSAIHVSGLDPFGKPTGPGFIRVIGRLRVNWHDEATKAAPPSGLGCRGWEPGIIVSWDGDAGGRGHRDDSWMHFALFSGTEGFLTARGLYQWWRERGGGAFSVRDVAEAIDAGRPPYLRTAGEEQHERAFRRLLESMVGVQNNKLRNEYVCAVQLIRHGRWEYTFSEHHRGW